MGWPQLLGLCITCPLPNTQHVAVVLVHVGLWFCSFWVSFWIVIYWRKMLVWCISNLIGMCDWCGSVISRFRDSLCCRHTSTTTGTVMLTTVHTWRVVGVENVETMGGVRANGLYTGWLTVVTSLASISAPVSCPNSNRPHLVTIKLISDELIAAHYRTLVPILMRSTLWPGLL
jgi:hypothetical protein